VIGDGELPDLRRLARTALGNVTRFTSPGLPKGKSFSRVAVARIETKPRGCDDLRTRSWSGYCKHVERDDIEEMIRVAFANVTLRSGISLRQAESIDRTSFGLEPTHSGPDPDEITNDWTRIPESELLRDNIAHLDPDGLRYYLPALMLWLLDHYGEDRWGSGSDMTVIGTIHAIAPSPEFAGRRWATYDTFTADQRTAIASFMQALPSLVSLDQEDATRVSRSMDRYWRHFLPPT
jgi:hypothetical protein